MTIADRLARAKQQITEANAQLKFEREHWVGAAYDNTPLGKLYAQSIKELEQRVATWEKIAADLEARLEDDPKAKL